MRYSSVAALGLYCVVSAVAVDTDVAVAPPPECSIRYTSGNALVVEGLVNGHWALQFRSGDGRIPMPDERWTDDAFSLSVNHEAVTGDWAWDGKVDDTTRDGSRRIVVTLVDRERGLRVHVCTQLDGTPILSRWLTIVNEGEAPLALTGVSPWSGRLSRGETFDLGYFTRDQHASEGWFEWRPLERWGTTIVSTKGQGHDAPFFILRNRSTGEYHIAHLAWSANWRLDVHEDLRGIVTFALGPYAEAPLRIIGPGEAISTPALHLGHIGGNLDDAVQAMHDHIRRSVLPAHPANAKGLIQFVVPGDQGYYTPFDIASAKQCVDVAAAIGAELFILDAYWWDVTCDWVPSAERFPDGLEPLVDYVRKKGLRFGLYVEAEGGRGTIRESRVAREHPDWLGPKDIVNVGNPEAAAWVESEMARLIEQYDLDLLRQDFNAEDTGGGLHTVQWGMPENNYWRYYEGCYGLYERLRARFPDVIFQQAAGGGARNDLGMVQRFHETYLTDGLWIPREQQSFAGQSLAFPPEMLVILHGATGHISPGYPENFETILRTTFALGTPQIFIGAVAPSVEELTPTRRGAFVHYANLYTSFIRPMLSTCRVFHHAPISDNGSVGTGGWFVMEFAAPDRTRGWILLIRTSDAGEDAYLLRPRGLDLGRNYRVTTDSTGTEATVTGGTLSQDGICVRLAGVAESELVLFDTE